MLSLNPFDWQDKKSIGEQHGIQFLRKKKLGETFGDNLFSKWQVSLYRKAPQITAHDLVVGRLQQETLYKSLKMPA